MSDDFMNSAPDFESEPVIADGKVKIGDDVNLYEKDPALHKIRIGLGWNLNAFDGDPLDLDSSLFFLDKDDQTRIDEDFLFYNNLMALDGAVKHHGDSRTGAGEGDDEMISLDLHGVPFDVAKIAIFVSIYQGLEREHSIGMIRNGYMRLMNEANQHELLRFEFSEELKERPETGLYLGALEREGPRWRYMPALEFYQGGLAEYAKSKGLVIIAS